MRTVRVLINELGGHSHDFLGSTKAQTVGGALTGLRVTHYRRQICTSEALMQMLVA